MNPFQEGTVWIHKPGEKAKRVPVALLGEHHAQGWERGQGRTPKPRTCERCGSSFAPPERWSRFCTPSCAGSGRAATFDARFRVDAFDEWSPDMAYALGLLITDGNISTDKRSKSWRVALEMTDEKTVRWFHDFLGNQNPIYVREPPEKQKIICGRLSGQKQRSYVSYVSSLRLGARLIELGVRPRKSWEDYGIPPVPDELFFDFLRGAVDGDGSISHLTFKGYPRLVVEVACNSPLFRAHLRQKLNEYNIESCEYGIKVRLNGRHAEALCQRVYTNSHVVRMQRKHEQWASYCDARQTSFGGLISEVGAYPLKPEPWHHLLSLLTNSEIHRRCGVTRETVQKHRLKLGVPLPAYSLKRKGEPPCV